MNDLRNSQWIQVFSPKVKPKLQIICFPHAGGGASLFRSWPEHFSSQVEVLAVRLPGRESRYKEPNLTRINTLSQILSEEIFASNRDTPLVIWGHSMGALLAFDLASTLEYNGFHIDLLAVSGRNPPHIKNGGDRHKLPDNSFLEHIAKLGGLPSEIQTNAELRSLYLPIIRSDYTMLETYRYLGKKISTSLLVCNALDDVETNETDMKRWGELSSGKCVYKAFDGGHFYTQKNVAKIAETIERVAELKTLGNL